MYGHDAGKPESSLLPPYLVIITPYIYDSSHHDPSPYTTKYYRTCDITRINVDRPHQHNRQPSLCRRRGLIRSNVSVECNIMSVFYEGPGHLWKWTFSLSREGNWMCMYQNSMYSLSFSCWQETNTVALSHWMAWPVVRTYSAITDVSYSSVNCPMVLSANDVFVWPTYEPWQFLQGILHFMVQ